jgi:hypothetical protein
MNNLQHINRTISILESMNATVVPPAYNSSYDHQQLTVNNRTVLVRFRHAPNTHSCIELLHEDGNCTWVKSWGLTSRAEWLLVVYFQPDTEYYEMTWFHLPSTRELAVKYITQDRLRVVNNSVSTRANKGPQANVLNVWLSNGNDSDYHITSHSNHRTSFSNFLSNGLRNGGQQ